MLSSFLKNSENNKEHLKNKQNHLAFGFQSAILKKIYMVLAVLMEKAMAPHSSIFAWKIPWTEEPGGLQSIGPKESDCQL